MASATLRPSATKPGTSALVARTPPPASFSMWSRIVASFMVPCQCVGNAFRDTMRLTLAEILLPAVSRGASRAGARPASGSPRPNPLPDTRLTERWLSITEVGEESVRKRRSMTALPPSLS